MSPQDIGAAGERLAQAHLRSRGYRTLARRLRTSQAELDLVFEKDGVLVVVEVKTGVHGPIFRPGGRHSPRTRNRQAVAARAIARSLGLDQYETFLVEVLLDPPQAPQLLLHRTCGYRAAEKLSGAYDLTAQDD